VRGVRNAKSKRRKRMTEGIKWDGTSPIDPMHEKVLRDVLIGEGGMLTNQEKELAKRTSYGDLGKTLRKKYCNGTSITIPINGVTYEMTWNKAAKAIHRWVKESTENG
jgi:hypothetical protein